MDARGVQGRQRVSCAGLCRIRDAQGRYLLGLNVNRLAQGRRIFMPLGGALRYDNPDLLAYFDAVPEDATTRDLRLFINPVRLDDFRAWFRLRERREITSFRELQEELVDEFRALTSLSPEDTDITFVGTYEGEGLSERQGVNGVWTYYLHDLFEVSFAADVLALLSAVPPETGLRWFTDADLLRGAAEDGTPINARALLDSS